MADGGRNSGERKTIIAEKFVVKRDFYNIQLSTSPPDPHALDKAKELFATLPIDIVPEPAPLPAGSYVSLRTNTLFVGREAELRALARIVATGETAAIGQIAAATGLGGIGKTQLAVEFAYRYGRFFAGGVFWLSFAEPAIIPAEVARCGGSRGLALQANFDSLSLQQQCDLVLAAWCSELPRLLIFDNCEDPSLVGDWRPPMGGTRVLVTTRWSNWPASLDVIAFPLGTLQPADSLKLLRKYVPSDDPILAAIAQELGHLPLALHMAGSYLERYRHLPLGQPSAYLADLRKNDLLAHPSLVTGSASPTGHELSVARTFALSWRRLDPTAQTDALARAALARAACFAPGEPIRRSWLRDSLDGTSVESSRRAEDALIRATELGLLEERADGALTLHRLLAHFVEMEGTYLMDAAGDSIEGLFFRLVEGSPSWIKGLGEVGVPFAMLDGVTKSSLPTERKLRILRAAAVRERDRGWRPKDWQNPEYRRSFELKFHEKIGFGFHLRVLSDKDPGSVRDALLNWLEDPTPLRHETWPEATVGDFAAGCLFWLRPGDFGALCEKLIRHPDPKAREILRTFISVYTDEIAVYIPVWLSSPMLRPEFLKLFRRVPIGAVRKPSMQLSLQQVLPAVLASALPMQQRLDAARIAVAGDVCTSEAWDVVTTAYRRRFPVGAISLWSAALLRLPFTNRLHTDVSSRDLVSFIRYRREDVFALLRTELETNMSQAASWDTRGRAFETIDSLSWAPSDPEALLAAVALLRTATAGGGTRGLAVIGDTVERLLNAADEEAIAKSDLLTFGEEIIRTGSQPLMEGILHFACYHDHTWARISARGLREVIRRAPLSEETIKLVLKLLLGPGGDPSAFSDERFHEIITNRERCGEEQSDLLLTSELWNHYGDNRLVDLILNFWQSQPPDKKTLLVQYFLRSRQNGSDLFEAYVEARRAISPNDPTKSDLPMG